MVIYERLRGAKMEVKSELGRLRDQDLRFRMDNEERIREMEETILNEERQKYSNTLSQVRNPC